MKKRNLLVIIIMIAVLVLLVGCSAHADEPEWVLVAENEILSAKVESRPLTNGLGGIVKYRNYVTYCYVSDDGTVEFDEHPLFEDYSNFIYEVIFYPSEESKVVKYECKYEGENQTRYEVYLTQENYEQIFTVNEEDVD
ncbi:MAG: hypothetical protein IJE68_02355 [Clostridia bacterium]|nr:hypothetical protein [Clostridia bacterium]